MENTNQRLRYALSLEGEGSVLRLTEHVLSKEQIDSVDSLLFSTDLAHMSEDLGPLVVCRSVVCRDASTVRAVVAGATLDDVGTRRIRVLLANSIMMGLRKMGRDEAHRLGLQWLPGMMFAQWGTLEHGTAVFTGSAQLFVAKRGQTWLRLARKHLWSPVGPKIAAFMDLVLETLTILALDRRYRWSVRLRVDSGPELEFLTTSEDARAIFRLRDRPPGAARRPALRHWVTRLGRRRSVRDNWYLRGAVDFEWNGIHCKIIPPTADRERLMGSGA